MPPRREREIPGLLRIDNTEAYNGKKLLRDLLKLKTTPDDSLKSRILDLDREIREIDQVIEEKEQEMNESVAKLYGMDAHQI